MRTEENLLFGKPMAFLKVFRRKKPSRNCGNRSPLSQVKPEWQFFLKKAINKTMNKLTGGKLEYKSAMNTC